VGTGSVLKGGITIGEYALVGVGSIITKNIPAHALYFGTPAKHQGWVCRCSSKLDAKLKCPDCKLQYKKSGEGLALKT
jgi:UDP-2-acetamido-3-amino-2,3-dideoxy-glucuronate N-acetyltransferase